MQYINPPHEVRNEKKLQSMIDTLESGKSLPPIVVCGNQAYTGSHRLAAWEACNVEPEVVEISENDLMIAIAKVNGIDDFNPDDKDDIEFFNNYIGWDVVFNDLCEILYKSDDQGIRNAVKDQR